MGRSIVAIGFILLVSAFVFFKDLGLYPLKNWDEAWYAEETRNMASGNYSYLVSFWNGRYYFDKPPLYSWVSLPIFRIFGPGEWQARAVSAASGVLATFFVFLITRKLFGPPAGGFASLIFLTLGQVVERISAGNLDGLLVFFTTASFYFYVLSLKKTHFVFISGFFLGLGFLTKGLFPGLFPVLALLTLLTHSGIGIGRQFRIFLSTVVLAVLVYIAWLIPSYLKFGRELLEWFTLGQSISQLSSFTFYLLPFTNFMRDIGFWWILVFFGLVARRASLRNQKGIFTSFLLSIIIYLVALSFLKEHYGWYLLLLYPFVAVILGSVVSFLSKQKTTKVFLAGILVILTVQLLLVERIRSIHPDRSRVVADLGRAVKEVVPREETLFLNDNDFSSFLYYSERGEVLVLKKGGGKEDEWWIKDEGYFSNMIAEGKRVWLITANIKKLDFDVTRLSEIRGLGEFKLLKFN